MAKKKSKEPQVRELEKLQKMAENAKKVVKVAGGQAAPPT